MVASDSAKNVCKACLMICTKFPWILTCPDPTHLLNLLSKDLIVGSKTYPKVKGFADVMTIVSTLTTYFSHSNYGRYHLNEEMKKESGLTCGIQAAGGTRFSIFSINACSMYCCFNAMQCCLKSGKLKFEGKGSQTVRKYLEDGDLADSFKADLQSVNKLLTPIARGLIIEGQMVMLSDIFSIFIGIVITFGLMFSNPSERFHQYQGESYATYNRRFAFLMEESSRDLFLLAYLLDPGEYIVVWSQLN